MAILDKAFGERFKIAFNYETNQQIAERLGVSAPAVQNYKDGRIPDGEKLQLIALVTKCDLHWLLTGEHQNQNVESENKEIDSITDEDIEEWEYQATNVEPSERFFVDVFRDTVVGIIRDTVPSMIENYLALANGEKLSRNSKVIKINKIQELGNIDEFNVEGAVEKYNNVNEILVDWYKHEGITDLSADFGFIFHNWDSMNFEDKVETVELCKKLADKYIKK